MATVGQNHPQTFELVKVACMLCTQNVDTRDKQKLGLMLRGKSRADAGRQGMKLISTMITMRQESKQWK